MSGKSLIRMDHRLSIALAAVKTKLGGTDDTTGIAKTGTRVVIAIMVVQILCILRASRIVQRVESVAGNMIYQKSSFPNQNKETLCFSKKPFLLV